MPFMNIKDGYISKKVTFDTQDSLDEKIDRLMSMMRKLTAQDDDQNKQFKPKYIKAKEGERQEISMIAAMVREIIKIDIGQIVETGEYHSVVEYKMDRIIVTDQGIIRTIEVILEEETLDKISFQIKITEVKIIEADTEEIIEMIIMEGVEVGLGIDIILIIAGTIEAAVGIDQVQEPV